MISPLFAIMAGILLSAVCCVGPTQAGIVALNLIGVIDSVSGTAAASEFVVGAPVAGILTYDTSVPDFNSDPTVGTYDRAFRVQLNLGYPVTGLGAVQIINGTAQDSFFGFASARLGGFLLGPPVQGVVPVQLQIVLQDMDATAFSSDALPAPEQLNLIAFEESDGILIFGGEQDNVHFAITSLQAIPEPTSMAVLAISFAVLIAMRRHRRSNST